MFHWYNIVDFNHYNDVIMGAIASQITSLISVYSTIYSGAHQRKHQSSLSLAFVPGEFPAQMANNADNVSIWWRHHMKPHSRILMKLIFIYIHISQAFAYWDLIVSQRIKAYARFDTWWRHQMETFSVLLGLCAGNSSVNSPHKGQ